MPRKVFKALLPDPIKLKNNRCFSVLGSAIHDAEFWHLTKHTVAGAFFIGIFCAFLPIPFQTLLAGLLAILFKRNLPLSVALVFVTNPLTIPPIFYFNYWLGCQLLDQAPTSQGLPVDDLWTWLWINFSQIGKPLIAGSVSAGLLCGALSYLAIHLFWLWRVRYKWKKRQLERTHKAQSLRH